MFGPNDRLLRATNVGRDMIRFPVIARADERDLELGDLDMTQFTPCRRRPFGIAFGESVDEPFGIRIG